jgi:hypothetical protein
MLIYSGPYGGTLHAYPYWLPFSDIIRDHSMKINGSHLMVEEKILRSPPKRKVSLLKILNS